ncbi:MAG: hypothetical protein Q7S21_06530 [archaeon]|nr:hypothetical protein [archaeon]
MFELFLRKKSISDFAKEDTSFKNGFLNLFFAVAISELIHFFILFFVFSQFENIYNGNILAAVLVLFFGIIISFIIIFSFLVFFGAVQCIFANFSKIKINLRQQYGKLFYLASSFIILAGLLVGIYVIISKDFFYLTLPSFVLAILVSVISVNIALILSVLFPQLSVPLSSQFLYLNIFNIFFAILCLYFFYQNLNLFKQTFNKSNMFSFLIILFGLIVGIIGTLSVLSIMTIATIVLPSII